MLHYFLKNDLINVFEILQRPFWHCHVWSWTQTKRFQTCHFLRRMSAHGVYVGRGSLGVFPAHFLRTIQYFLIKFWTDFPGITRMVTILKIPRHALSLRGRFGYVNLFFENHSIFSHKILLRWDVLVFGTFWLSQSQCQKSFRRCVCFLLPGITILGYFGG